MSSRSFNQHWRRLVDRDLDYFRTKLPNDGFSYRDRSLLPQIEVETFFSDGLLLQYADQPTLARRYLRQAVASHDHLIATDRFRSRRCKRYFPINRGQSGRAAAYSRLMLGQKPPRDLLLVAAADTLAWLRDGQPMHSDSTCVTRLLSCSVQLMLAGDPEAAKATLLGPRFRHFEPVRLLILDFIKALSEQTASVGLRANIARVVDRHRGPACQHPGLAVDAAMLWSLLRSPISPRIDPRAMISLLSR